MGACHFCLLHDAGRHQNHDVHLLTVICKQQKVQHKTYIYFTKKKSVRQPEGEKTSINIVKTLCICAGGLVNKIGRDLLPRPPRRLFKLPAEPRPSVRRKQNNKQLFSFLFSDWLTERRSIESDGSFVSPSYWTRVCACTRQSVEERHRKKKKNTRTKIDSLSLTLKETKRSSSWWWNLVGG